jgi:hypothetical protein
LEELRAEHSLDFVFFTGIDILAGFNLFIAADDKSLEVFSEALGLELNSSGTKVDFVLLRKQIWPKVKNLLERQ